MYVARFHLCLLYRLSRHGLDSDPALSSTGVDIVYNYHEVSTWTITKRNVDGNPSV